MFNQQSSLDLPLNTKILYVSASFETQHNTLVCHYHCLIVFWASYYILYCMEYRTLLGINVKTNMPNPFTYLNWTLIFEWYHWYVVWCYSKKGFQKKMCLKKIGQHDQNIITILSSIVNMIGETYTII